MRPLFSYPRSILQLKRGDDCKCYNPTYPAMLDRSEQLLHRWNETFYATMETAANLKQLDSLEVALVGDSITEHWTGKDLNRESRNFAGVAGVFQELFRKENGGRINGVALGVAAERCANTLYRLQNGGMGDLNPGIWWVLIGTNDLGGEHCTEEAIVAGNINIVQEILSRRPEALVVINSLLPRPPAIWKHLSRVNERLKCYAESTHNVKFFNATDLFMEPANQTLIGLLDELHPSVDGSRRWGSAIVDKVLELTQEKKETH